MTRFEKINLALTIVKYATALTALILVIGTVGSLETEAIGFGQFFVQIAVAVYFGCTSYFADKVQKYINN
jgi:hypothetical protein